MLSLKIDTIVPENYCNMRSKSRFKYSQSITPAPPMGEPKKICATRINIFAHPKYIPVSAPGFKGGGCGHFCIYCRINWPVTPQPVGSYIITVICFGLVKGPDFKYLWFKPAI